MGLELQTGSDALHAVAQSLLLPTVIVLLGLLAFTAYQFGSLAIEYFTERRRLTVRLPVLLRDIETSPADQLNVVIERSGMLRRQKVAAREIVAAADLPQETLVSLARGLLAREEARWARTVSVTDTVARIAPMFGLMGTLIPLAPGLMGLAKGDVKTLSDALLVGFDTTIAGLAASAVCFVISKVRSHWYQNYMSQLEAALTSLLSRISEVESRG